MVERWSLVNSGERANFLLLRPIDVLPIVPKEILQLSANRPLLAKLAVTGSDQGSLPAGLVRYTPKPAAAHWTGPGAISGENSGRNKRV
jgi:hypothetical protein